MIIVVPIAGGDDLFQRHGFPYAKPVIEIAGRPLIEHAVESLKTVRDAQFVFVIRREDDIRFYLRDMLRLLDPAAHVILANGATAGAACTALLAVNYIDCEEEILIANGDQILNANLEEFVASFRARDLDAATVVFDSVHPRWSFVKVDEQGFVIEAAEKRPISRNATAGIYYFRKGRDFVCAAKKMILKGSAINGAYFICPTFNEMILAQKRVGVVQIDREQYISLATPQAVEEYEQSISTSLRSNPA